MIRILMAALALAGCASVSSGQGALQITSLIQGLMRNEGGTWRVYKPGDTFNYQENGECTAAGKRMAKCMWHGFEFDFSAPTESTTLSCVAHTSSPIDFVTYESEEAKDAREYRFDLKLSGRSGHVTNPGYLVLGPEDKGDQRTQVECSHAGKVVLRHSFNIHGV